MTEKLKDYQVIDVFCGGTFYKVKHKVTNNIFAWKAYNCSAYTDERLQILVQEVKTISKVTTDSLLRYYDSILHAPSKTLYFVLEYNSWRSVQELIESCQSQDKYVVESFIWYLLHELARVCKHIEHLRLSVLQKCISSACIFVGEKGELRINCFRLGTQMHKDMMRQVGDVIHDLCYRPGTCVDILKEFHYSDELRDVVGFLTDEKNTSLLPDVVLYHPTVLTKLENKTGPKSFNDLLVSADYSYSTSEANKCDSEKAGELCRVIQPLPRTLFNITDSPIYSNISPKKKTSRDTVEPNSPQGSLSPTLAALALELPGYVPRSRKPYLESLERYNCAQQVSEDTFNQQWMSRLMALRQREESLNKRERDLISKEIVSSPAAKFIPLNVSADLPCERDSNGITLPPVITHFNGERREWFSRRRRRRTGSVRSKGHRKSCGYEDLDSSLSADTGDSSIIVTATKFTKDNMPRRSIFPDNSTKKVHFTSANPFAESDESVTLTFYELDKVDSEVYHQPTQTKMEKDISKFKYLDLEKVNSEKRAAMHWSHSSPSKQAKMTKNIFNDITNHSSMRKTPSKTSLSSRGSNTSRFSMMSTKSHWSTDSSKLCEGSIADRTRSSMKQYSQTPVAAPDKKAKSRKSLLNFKTPFKFMTKN